MNDETLELVLYDGDAERWAPIATWAEAEPEKALQAFELRVRRMLSRPQKDFAYNLARAVGQCEKRLAMASLAAAEAEKHKPADGWRAPVTLEVES